MVNRKGKVNLTKSSRITLEKRKEKNFANNSYVTQLISTDSETQALQHYLRTQVKKIYQDLTKYEIFLRGGFTCFRKRGYYLKR